MKYRIDYNLKGHARFWVCEWPSSFRQDDALTALIRLHAHADSLTAMRVPLPATHEELAAAVADLGISDVRIKASA
ncbi:hypothetical protein ACI2KG_00580 [Pseudomonas sp. NPDC089407]|uniref:hypothetical protein n=1 Tax=Pseudomonas sp. NPDC089407 TaxID=3364464 RepID=UPI00384E2558